MRTTFLILFSVTCSGIAQLFLKKGSMSLQVSSIEDAMQHIVLNKNLILGILLYGIGFISWIVALTKAEVSFAYMFNSLAFIIVALGGYFLLGESMNASKVIGIVCILIGIFFVVRS